MGANTERSDGRRLALSETMRAFAEATVDFQRLLRTVAQRVAFLIGDGCALLLLSEDQQQLTVSAIHFRGYRVTGFSDAEAALASVRDDPVGEHLRRSARERGARGGRACAAQAKQHGGACGGGASLSELAAPESPKALSSTSAWRRGSG